MSSGKYLHDDLIIMRDSFLQAAIEEARKGLAA
jgi:hypothetical protein